MKILVTGATGFVGNYVIQELLKNKHTVIASSASEAKAAIFEWYSSVEYIPFRLEEYNEATNYFEFFHQPDIMIHLAWEGLPNYKAVFHLEENLPRHLRFLGNIIGNGLKDLTVTGTCFEYGMQEGKLSEDMPAKPDNPYAQAKDSLRKELQQLQGTKDFELKWVRLFYMYGKGQSQKSLISQLDKALEDNEPSFNMSAGEQVRDFLPVEKVATYIVAIALQQQVTGVINCCSGKPVTVKQFVEQYLAHLNRHIKLNLGYYPYADYEPMVFWGDDTKLKSISNNL